MDYGEAAEIIRQHSLNIQAARGVVRGHASDKKKLKNETWLVWETVDGRDASTDMIAGESFYSLKLFDKTIISFYSTHLKMHDRGFFSRTTHDRFNEFLPRGFRVWGTTFRELRRLLGFIKTPAGVFPYNMPARFRYSGENLDSMTPLASEAAHLLPSYLDQYLSYLLSRHNEALSPIQEEEEDLFLDLFESHNPSGDPDSGVSSSNAAMAVVRNKFYPTLVRRAAQLHGLPDKFADVLNSPLEIATLLVKEGASAFKRVRTKADLAQQTERVIEHRMPIPVIREPTLRKQLKTCLNQYMLDVLGFDKVQWHRR